MIHQVKDYRVGDEVYHGEPRFAFSTGRRDKRTKDLKRFEIIFLDDKIIKLKEIVSNRPAEIRILWINSEGAIGSCCDFVFGKDFEIVKEEWNSEVRVAKHRVAYNLENAQKIAETIDNELNSMLL